MAGLTNAIELLFREADALLADKPKLLKMFKQCFVNTIETTTKQLSDGTTFIFTGDIPAMWLRDSSAQVRHYLPLIKDDKRLEALIEGLLRRQIEYISMDPYANAFNEEPSNRHCDDDRTEMTPWIWERKYEIDSLCYPLELHYLYWKATGNTMLFNERFRAVISSVIRLWTVEQRHFEDSPYRFERMTPRWTDTLRNDGMGMPVNYTGMTWSGFRPSDDACTFNYLIPSNMFAVVVLRYVREIMLDIYNDEELAKAAAQLMNEIEYGIETYGTVIHPVHGKIYAYETDGYGNHNLMDDANVPSLLSIPYIGYRPKEDDVYQNTRRFVLSAENPYYYEGKVACGVGSPHTPDQYIWHIGLNMQILTAIHKEEKNRILEMIVDTDADTGYMHEGFHVDDPARFTRSWFTWANSLFAEAVYGIMKDDGC